MQTLWSLEQANLQGVWLTIGSFDGVHRGHQAIIKKLVTSAHNAVGSSVVLTFYPHPATVLRDRIGPYSLTTVDEKAQILGVLGVDYVIIHPFSKELAKFTARQFILLLKNHLGLAHLLAGHDFALGRNREGNFAMLTELGKELNFSVNLMRPITIQGEVISSSRIRTLIAEGNVMGANSLLGHDYSVQGKVVHGDGRGRVLGIPTANLEIPSEKMMPYNGVYAGIATVKGKKYRAVSNIGIRPTFQSDSNFPRIETHLLGFYSDLYGERIELSFHTRLRDEMRFPDLPTLIAQIHLDIEKTKLLL